MAVKEDEHQRRTADVEPLRDVQEHPVVIEGLVFPKHAAITAVALAPVLIDVEEWPTARRLTVIRERRGVEAHEFSSRRF